MRITSLIILIFLMSAFAVGVSLQDSNTDIIDGAISNATIVLDNITFSPTNNSYTDGILIITGSYIKFVGVTIFQIMKLGILFGQDNPEYFEPDFILSIIKLIVWLFIITLLIKPLFYFIIFVAMIGIWIKDKLNKKEKLDGDI